MAYSPAAKALRRCADTTRTGAPCRAWAVWGDPSRRCISHGGQAPTPARGDRDRHYARVVPCTCPAYAWPHRPCSGLCRWPDPPTHRSTTPASTHQWPSRFREWMGRLYRGTCFGGPVYLLRPDPLESELVLDDVFELHDTQP